MAYLWHNTNLKIWERTPKTPENKDVPIGVLTLLKLETDYKIFRICSEYDTDVLKSLDEETK